VVPQAQWADLELVIVTGHDTDLESACPRAVQRAAELYAQGWTPAQSMGTGGSDQHCNVFPA
jgi:hypothetical protein